MRCFVIQMAASASSVRLHSPPPSPVRRSHLLTLEIRAGLIGKTFSALGYGLILLMAFGALRSIQAEAERKKAKGN